MNLKKTGLFIIFILVCSFLSAEILDSRYKITQSEEEFDVLYYLYDDMSVIENKENDDVNITQSFKISNSGIEAEIRYSLFTDCGGNEDYLMLQYAMMVFACMSNAVGYEVADDMVSAFNDSDVAQEFNGDFGCNAFFTDMKSEFAEGYNYMMVEFFGKKNQGLVMRTMLFNDLAFVGLSEDGHFNENNLWLSHYHTFKFMDKDEKGNYVK